MEYYDGPQIPAYEIEHGIKKSYEQLEKMGIGELNSHLKDLDNEIEILMIKVKGPKSNHWAHEMQWELVALRTKEYLYQYRGVVTDFLFSTMLNQTTMIMKDWKETVNMLEKEVKKNKSNDISDVVKREVERQLKEPPE
ncbi:MAG: hypothetical protein GKS07_10360 [Nitrosopumilus sp.]|nr:MAG: hypothetical protein GKS07_10360 [Nitrosopumilus sp.]